MKKLLAMGALLVVASTSFGAVTTELAESNVLSTKKYEGHANLPISVKGRVIDLTGKYVLVVTPTTTAGADGASLEFDFGNLLPGTDGNQQIGKFKAEIYTKTSGNMKSEEIVKQNLNSNGYGTSVVTATLVGDGVLDGKQIGESSLKEGAMLKVDLNSTTVGAEEQTATKIGEVTYQLVNTGVDGSGETFEGEVVSTIKINNDAVAGAFNDKSAKVKISVTDFQPKQ